MAPSSECRPADAFDLAAVGSDRRVGLIVGQAECGAAALAQDFRDAAALIHFISNVGGTGVGAVARAGPRHGGCVKMPFANFAGSLVDQEVVVKEGGHRGRSSG